MSQFESEEKFKKTYNLANFDLIWTCRIPGREEETFSEENNGNIASTEINVKLDYREVVGQIFNDEQGNLKQDFVNKILSDDDNKQKIINTFNKAIILAKETLQKKATKKKTLDVKFDVTSSTTESPHKTIINIANRDLKKNLTFLSEYDSDGNIRYNLQTFNPKGVMSIKSANLTLESIEETDSKEIDSFVQLVGKNFFYVTPTEFKKTVNCKRNTKEDPPSFDGILLTNLDKYNVKTGENEYSQQYTTLQPLVILSQKNTKLRPVSDSDFRLLIPANISNTDVLGSDNKKFNFPSAPNLSAWRDISTLGSAIPKSFIYKINTYELLENVPLSSLLIKFKVKMLLSMQCTISLIPRILKSIGGRSTLDCILSLDEFAEFKKVYNEMIQDIKDREAKIDDDDDIINTAVNDLLNRGKAIISSTNKTYSYEKTVDLFLKNAISLEFDMSIPVNMFLESINRCNINSIIYINDIIYYTFQNQEGEPLPVIYEKLVDQSFKIQNIINNPVKSQEILNNIFDATGNVGQSFVNYLSLNNTKTNYETDVSRVYKLNYDKDNLAENFDLTNAKINNKTIDGENILDQIIAIIRTNPNNPSLRNLKNKLEKTYSNNCCCGTYSVLSNEETNEFEFILEDLNISDITVGD
jgi:hypothetical protein